MQRHKKHGITKLTNNSRVTILDALCARYALLSVFSHTSHSSTQSSKADPFMVAIALVASSAVPKIATADPFLPISTNLQPSPMCSLSFLFKSTLFSSPSARPPIHTFFSGGPLCLEPFLPLPFPPPLPQPPWSIDTGTITICSWRPQLPM